MNEVLKDKLQIIANDKYLIQALVELFSERIDKEMPTIQSQDGNLLLGEKYRAYMKAKEMLSKTIADLTAYSRDKSKKDKFNREV